LSVAAADQNPTPWKMSAPKEAVAESAGRTYWSVSGRSWRLPDELVALVAPPVVVSAAPR